MDSYYGGLPTAELVHEKGMCFIMSCRKDRPTELFANNLAKNLEKGEVNYKSNGRFVAMTWKDRKPFNCMTNCFTGDTMTAESPKIPLVVYHYRTHYGHVDRFDNQQALYSPQTRTTKWTQAYFRAMLKLTLNNSRILYISRTQKQISLLDWTRTIILALKYKHNPSVPKSVPPVGHFPLLLSGWKQRCKMCQKKHCIQVRSLWWVVSSRVYEGVSCFINAAYGIRTWGHLLTCEEEKRKFTVMSKH